MAHVTVAGLAEVLRDHGFGDMGDVAPGAQARLMSQAMRKLTAAIHKSHTSMLFINQLRMKIGVMFGSPEVTSGGNALKFYSSVRIDIRRSTQIKDGDVVHKMVEVKKKRLCIIFFVFFEILLLPIVLPFSSS